MQLMMSFSNGMRAAAETRGTGMMQQHYVSLRTVSMTINESSELGICKSRARLANKGTRLVKQGGDFSCWDEIESRKRKEERSTKSKQNKKQNDATIPKY